MEEMVEEQKVEERAQAVKRLRSLFDMHKVVFGAPVNLRGMLLNLHHDRHFSMDFWAVVNSFSEGGGSGSLTEEEMFEAVVESVTGVTSGAMPAYEHPAVVELSQMIGGVDVLRPAAEALEPVEPLPEDLSHQQEMVAKHPASADRAASIADEVDADELDRRRTIGEALARLEQTTRELREQLAEIDSKPLDSQAPETIAAAAAPVVEVTEPLEQRTATPAPVRPAQPESVPAIVVPDDELQGEEQEDDLTGSPLAEALPPHRFIDVVRAEPRPSAVSMPAAERVARAPETVSRIRPKPVIATQPASMPRVPAAESDPIDPGPLSSPMEQIRPPASAASTTARPAAVPTPVVPAATAPVTPPVVRVETEVFDPKPAHKLSQRGLAIPPPLAEDEINANPPSFGRYGEEPEPSSSSRGGMVAMVLILLLGAGAYAGSRTEQGRDLLANARQWIETTYNSVTGHSETSETPVSTPAPQPTSPNPNTTAPQASTTPQTTETPQPAASVTPAAPSPVVSAPAPTTTAPAQPSAAESETPRAPRRQPFVDDSVLRVPSSAMTSALISSRAPVYPPAALSQQVDGVVTLDVVIGSNGLVKFAKAIDGDRLLQAAAEEAVLRWRYKPYILSGEPVSVSTTVQVRFKLPEE